MAKFTRIERKYYLSSDRTWYLVDGILTEDDVKKINSLNNKIVLILRNTKGQNRDIIKKFSSKNVMFSVMGGLDYLNKQKFRDVDYVDRTILTPIGLSKIIEYFEKIEEKLRYTWTDEQKCMYIYKTLVENLHYKYDNESDYEDGKDVVRSLYGLLYGKLVCSGFALVFKEAMDRIGVPCIYQNRRGHHSWNIVKLNNKLRGIELTWDCYNKGKDNRCGFIYFGREQNFYKNKHHDISSEQEEKEYPLEPFTVEELRNNLRIIENQGNIKKIKMNGRVDRYGNRIYYLKTNMYGNISEYMVLIENNLFTVYTSESESIVLTKPNIENACTYSNGYIGNGKIPTCIRQLKSFKRKDNSTFKLTKTQKTKDNINEFYYYDTVQERDGIYFRRFVLLSEMDLTLNWDDSIKNVIANNLLSKERISRKSEHYHGYVGYIGQDSHVYYKQSFEENNLNVHKRY